MTASVDIAPKSPDAAPVPATGIITFAHGLPGFEQCRRFVLVSNSSVEPFVCLNALDDPQPSFVAVDPRRVLPAYDQPLTPADRRRLEVDGDEPLLWLALVRVGREDASVNLQAPIVVNPRRMIGVQVLAAEASYSAAHPLSGI